MSSGNAGTYSGYSIREQGLGGIQLILSQPGLPCGRVTRLSPTTVWAVPDSQVRLPARQQVLQVMLDSNGNTIGPLKSETLWSNPKRQDAPFGLNLVDVSVEQGRRILAMLEEGVRNGWAEPVASPLPIQEAVTETERIRKVVSTLASVGNKGVLRRPGQSVHVVLEHFDAERELLSWRCTDEGAVFGEPPYDVELVGYNSAYRMHLVTPEPQGNHMVTSLPKRLWRVRHRWHRRVPAPAGLHARFLHPLWGAQLGERSRELVDVSFAGLSLRIDSDDLVFPGLVLQPLEVDVPGQDPIRLRAEVRHVSRSQVGGMRVCGLEVHACTTQDEARWVHLVSQELCPTTRTSNEMLDALWQLFIDSRYFNLGGKSAEHFEELRGSFAELGQRAARLPRLFCQTVWPSERGVEATLSFTRPYRYAWMLHQLAKRPGSPPGMEAKMSGQILRDIYVRTLEHAQADPDFRWIVAYAESTVSFVNRTHVRFGEKMAPTGQALVLPVRMMDVYCNEPSGQDASMFDIGPATQAEKELLVAEVQRTRPACYVEALDFTPERLDLFEAAEPWKAVSMERERRILVARRDGKPLAAAVLELGQPGTNLFRLLDAMRLIPLAPEGRDAYVALLDEARRWYAQRGRTAFLFLREDEDTSYAQAARLHDEPAARPVLWIMASAHVPEFIEHINEMTVGQLSPSQQPA
jgi:hypothetical protein